MEKRRLTKLAAYAVFSLLTAFPLLHAQLAVYETPRGFEILDINQATATSVPYDGPGPTTPLPSDIDGTFTPDKTKLVYPTQQGFEILNLATRTSTFARYGGGFPTAPLPLGNDVIIAPNGRVGVYPSPRGFEVLDLGTDQARLVGFAGPGPGPIAPLPLDVDVVITPDSSRAIYPTPSGFEILNLARGTAEFVPYELPGTLGFLPIAVDVVVTDDSEFAVYPTPTAFQVLDILGGRARRLPYAGPGPIIPLPVDVDVFINGTSEAIYPTPSGFEVLDVPGQSVEFVAYGGNGPTIPMPMSVDAPLTTRGAHAVYPTQSGFEVLDISARTSTHVPYARALVTAPIPLGVDVVIDNGDKHVVYPSVAGFHLLDLASNTAEFILYAGNGPTTPLPLGVDAVITSDQANAVYPTQQGFEVLDLSAKTTRFIPFGRAPTIAPLPIDVDPSFLADNNHLVYTTNLGFELLDLAAGTSTAVPYGTPLATAPLPAGVDAMVTPHDRAFSNDDPGDEDFFPFLFADFPHYEWYDYWYLNVPGKVGFPEDIEEKIVAAAQENGFAREDLRFIEAPAGFVAADGMEADSFAEAGLSLDHTTGVVSGTGTSVGHWWFLIWVVAPDHSFIAELWLHHWTIPHLEWEHTWDEGEEAEIPIPGEQLEAIHAAAIEVGADPATLVYEAAPGGTTVMGMEASSFEESGLELDSQTGTMKGIAHLPGHFWFLIWVRDPAGNLIAELWIHHWVIEHIEWTHVWLVEQEADIPIPPDIMEHVQQLAIEMDVSPDTLEFVEAEAGTVAMDGIANDLLGDAALELDPTTGNIKGIAGGPAQWWFLIHVQGPNGMIVADLWIHHIIIPRIPHFTWKHTWKPDQPAELPVPEDVMATVAPNGTEGLTFEAAEPGLIHHDGIVNNGTAQLGLEVNPQTGSLFGSPITGHGKTLIWVRGPTGELIAEFWIDHWIVPHWERFETWPLGEEGSSTVLDSSDENVLNEITQLAREMGFTDFDLSQITVREAPSGTVTSDGMVSNSVEEAGLKYDPETRQIVGTPQKEGEFWFLFWIEGPNGELLVELWLHHRIVPPVPHLEWELSFQPSDLAIAEFPSDLLEKLSSTGAALGGLTFEAAPDGLLLHDGSTVDGLGKIGLELDPQSGTIIGVPERAGHWRALIYVQSETGIIAEIWVHIWVIPHVEWDHIWVVGEFADMPLTESIQGMIAQAAERAGVADLSQIRFEEAPPGTVGMDGIVSTPLAEGFLELNPETGSISGTPFFPGEHTHLVHVVTTEGEPLLEIWIRHRILEHFSWDIIARVGENVEAKLPPHIIEGLQTVGEQFGVRPGEFFFQESDPGAFQPIFGEVFSTATEAGLRINPETADAQGTVQGPGHWIIPVEIITPDREVAAVIWIYYWVLPPVPHLVWDVEIPIGREFEIPLPQEIVDQGLAAGLETGAPLDAIFFNSAPRGAKAPDGAPAIALFDLGLDAFSFFGPPTLVGFADPNRTGEFQSLIWVETETGLVVAEIWVNLRIGETVVPEPPRLEYFLENGRLFLRWEGPFGLEVTREIGSPWELITGATSPFPIDLIDPFGFFRLISLPTDGPSDPGTDPGQPGDSSLRGVNDEFTLPPGAISERSVAVNDTFPAGAVFELVNGPDLHPDIFQFNPDGTFRLAPLTFGAPIQFEYQIVNGTERSEPIQVSVSVDPAQLVELEEDGNGNVLVPTLVLGGLHYPTFQFINANSPGDNCKEPHWHAQGFLVFPLENPVEGLIDPDPGSCGFGRVKDVPQEQFRIPAGDWDEFLELVINPF